MFSWPKIQVSIPGRRAGGGGSILKRDHLLQDAEKCKEHYLDGSGRGSNIQEEGQMVGRMEAVVSLRARLDRTETISRKRERTL